MTDFTFEVLRITDGTDEHTVDILPWYSGWTPQTAKPKGGGVFRASPFTPGRVPVLYEYENISDTILLNPSGSSSGDQLIFETSTLREVLEMAIDYWTSDWDNNTPVWIEARGTGETNSRYALIFVYLTPNDSNPYGGTFVRSATFDNWPLTIEHSIWLGDEPRAGTAIEIGASKVYDGRRLGNVDASGVYDPSSDDYAVYLGNHQKIANLTDVYYFDSSLAAFSANLMDAALPVSLLPNPVGVNDVLYIGIDTTVADSGPFSNVVFNVSTIQISVYAMSWQYWNGAAWVNMTRFQDNTDANGAITGFPFTTLGIRALSWEVQSNWATTTINGITGYWIRGLVTALGGPGPIPAVATKMYTVSWPYVDIADDQVGGDIPAIAKATFRNHCDSETFQILPQNRMITAQRRLSRGDDFSAFLNVGTQLATGISITNVTSTALVTDVLSHTGDARQYSGSGSTYQQAFRITIDNTRSVQYYGKFKVFIRATLSGGAGGDVFYGYVALAFGSTGNIIENTNRELINFGSGYYAATDLGSLEIPDAGSDGYASIHLSVWLQHPSGTGNLNVSDIIILPSDEMIVDSIDTQSGGYSEMGRESGNTKIGLVVDAIGHPRDGIRSIVLDSDNGYYYGEWKPVVRNTLQITGKEELRWWFFSFSTLGGVDTDMTAARNEFLNSLVLEKLHRYLWMRGDR